MRRLRALFLPPIALLLTGCGYIHFGRSPEFATSMGDAKFAEAYTNLATEHKILKQELALARREGDALRIALERSGATSTTGGSDLLTRLSETAGELAALRVSHAKLQAERSNAPSHATAVVPELEAKLAAALRDSTQLQAENARLRGEIDRARSDNTTLADKLEAALRQSDRAQTEVAQLNAELLAQKQARARAEQMGDALRAQLGTVMAQSLASGVSPLQRAKAPPAGASPTAELRTQVDRLRAPETENSQPLSPTPAASPDRKHTVQTGDTLEKLSQRYYGAPDRWPAIYEANSTLLGDGQPLRAGMELTIPEN